MLERYDLIYLAVVAVSGAVLLFLLRRYLYRVEDRRRERLERWKGFHAIRGRAPTRRATELAREKALESTETRFTVIRRALMLAGILVWVLAMVFPFLGAVPATVASVFTAAAVLLGIAARPVVENVVSGVVISLSRPFRIGDTVKIDGYCGTIEDISMTPTTVKKWDVKNSAALWSETAAQRRSAGDVEMAAAAGVYDRLELADIDDYLSVSYRTYDFFVAADVLIYIGDLDAVFTGVKSCAKDFTW